MKLNFRQTIVRSIAALAALAAFVAASATPATADHLPGYCVGADEPVGSVSVCTP